LACRGQEKGGHNTREEQNHLSLNLKVLEFIGYLQDEMSGKTKQKSRNLEI
jgi:hypothetical protein